MAGDRPTSRDPLGDAGLTVAPMGPELAPALVTFHEALTSATTRNRFFTVHPHLSVDEVVRFTTVDHHDREAFAALDPSGAIVAVARFDRLGPASSTAEVAFVVADAWQHHGIGAALFRLLASRAVAVGIERFVADTLAGNRAMRAVFRQAGYPCREEIDHGVVRVTIDLGPH
jgi:RimJ/RimL family protein N-acetyltransferase